MTDVLSPHVTSSSPSIHDAPRSESPGGPPRRRERRPEQRERTPSYAQHRMSSYSQRTSRSRPHSSVFPAFQSSLPYALVRDFAYPLFHPMHYGAPPEPSSGTTTPGSEGNAGRRLSDPMDLNQNRSGGWSAGPWGGDGIIYGDPEHEGGTESLPSTSFGDEVDGGDEAGVWRSKHRKSKSYASISDYERGRRRDSNRRSRRISEDGSNSELFQLSDPAGRESLRQSRGYSSSEQNGGRRDSRFATTLPPRSFHNSQPASLDPDDAMPLDAEVPSSPPRSPQRQSIGPEDEDLYAGPSLALYSFEPENANELRLREMQVIMVSYRHGQGWLVAEDPETGEQGLVPEEYVRLLSDIPNYDPTTRQFIDMEGESEVVLDQSEETGMDGSLDGKVRETRVDEAYEEPSDDALEMPAQKLPEATESEEEEEEEEDDDDDDD